MTAHTEPAAAPPRFRDREIAFANGSVGENVEIPSADPRNYHEAITRPDSMATVTIDGKLFLPPRARSAVPVVVVVPGSLSVAPSHLRHAEAFTDMGMASFVLDLTLAGSWGACMDVGGKYAGTVSGSMNMAGNIGAFGFPLIAGELAESAGWPSVLLLVTGLNFAALLCWIFLNVERPIVEKVD